MISTSIGIVVIGRNEGERLVRCLSSIDSGVYRVVYVDSMSIDSSVATAERLGASVVKLDSSKRLTAARARNEGFAALAKLQRELQYVQFVDGDCELDDGWLDAAARFIAQRSNVAVVCGRRRELHPDASVYNRLCDIEWNTPIGEIAGCGGDALMRADAFSAAGGFAPQLMAGEEPELCFRLRNRGWKIWRIDHEMTRHDAAMLHFGQWWMRAVRSGYGWAEVFRMYRESAIYRREISSAVIFGGILPLAIFIGILIHPLAAAAILIYPLQVLRIAIRQGFERAELWTYAFFMVTGKFAALQGILKFCWNVWNARAAREIEYK